ncbi:class Ib ribonucleoside-diphosphate reductase assembly flavoprotein NrdI, partial [Enterococcus lactis]|uniref:class Ib ribonucleoside-diphosphate reductase assembly flavoprotein NrdI n=1 Tax=Enterococcus lactis TaxID=357441 RepID=UPI003908101C
DYDKVKDRVKNNDPFGIEIKEPYFAFLPAYLEGVNGVTTGNTEILTTPLRSLIDYKKNSKYFMGIIGSGIRNFNKHFCLT